MALQQPIDRGFRDKVTLCISEAYCQLTWRESWLIKCQIDDLTPDLVGDAVLDMPRQRPVIL